MLARFKKLGHSLQKAGKSVEESLEKAGKSVGKGVGKSSKGADAKSTATTADGRRDTQTAPGSTGATADNRSVRSAATDEVEGGVSRTNPSAVRPSTATPRHSESLGGSSVRVNLDQDGSSLPGVSPPPPASLPATPLSSRQPQATIITTTTTTTTTQGDGHKKESEVPQLLELPPALVTQAPAKLSSRPISSKATPVESRLSTHNSVEAVSRQISGSGDSSIQFDVNTTGGNTASASPLRLQPSNGFGEAAEPPVRLSHLGTSLSFDVAADDGEGKEGANAVASQPLNPTDAESSAEVHILSGSSGHRTISVDESAAVEGDHGDDAGSAKKRVAKAASEVDEQRTGGEHPGVDDEGTQRKVRHPRQRKSSAAKEGKRRTSGEEEEEAGEGDGNGNAGHRPKRRKPSKVIFSDEESVHSGKRTARKPSPAVKAPPSTSSSRAPSPSSRSSSSSSSSPPQRRRGGRKHSPRHPQRKAPPPAKGNGSPPAPGQPNHRRAQEAAKKGGHRSDGAADEAGKVSADVLQVFNQCRLDGHRVTPPKRLRRASPTEWEHHEREHRSSFRGDRPRYRSRSPREQQGHFQRRVSPRSARDYWDDYRNSSFDEERGGRGGGWAMRGSAERHRSSSLSGWYESRRSGRSHSLRRGHSNLRRGGCSDYGSSASSSSGDPCVTYDARRRELYRGAPRERRQPASSLPASASARRRRRQQSSSSPPSATRGRGTGDYYVATSSMQRRSRYAPATAVEYHVVRAQPARSRPSPSFSEPSLLDEEQILEEVEYKLEILAEQIAAHDFALEHDMMSSPFERLYHMNNQRDRKERRELLTRFNRLQAIREKIVTGALDREIAERAERQHRFEEKLRDPNGVYMRLYQSPRRRGAELEATLNAKTTSGANGSSRNGSSRNGSSRNPTSAPPSRTASPSLSAGGTAAAAREEDGAVDSRVASARRARSRSRTKAEQDAYFNRIYTSAVEGMRRKKERIEAAQKAQEQQEYEEYLVSRLVGRMQRASPSTAKQVPTPEEILAEARKKLEEEKKEGRVSDLAQNLLHDRRITREEEERLGTRLTKHGRKNERALAALKEAKAKQQFTFKPLINSAYPLSARGAGEARRGSDGIGSDSGTNDSDGDAEDRTSREAAEERQRAHDSKFEELYRKGMAAKQRALEVQQQKDRELRLKILKSRLSSDHHFRRRVELDPSLAERFMSSLDV